MNDQQFLDTINARIKELKLNPGVQKELKQFSTDKEKQSYLYDMAIITLLGLA